MLGITACSSIQRASASHRVRYLDRFVSHCALASKGQRRVNSQQIAQVVITTLKNAGFHGYNLAERDKPGFVVTIRKELAGVPGADDLGAEVLHYPELDDSVARVREYEAALRSHLSNNGYTIELVEDYVEMSYLDATGNYAAKMVPRFSISVNRL